MKAIPQRIEDKWMDAKRFVEAKGVAAAAAAENKSPRRSY